MPPLALENNNKTPFIRMWTNVRFLSAEGFKEKEVQTGEGEYLVKIIYHTIGPTSTHFLTLLQRGVESSGTQQNQTFNNGFTSPALLEQMTNKIKQTNDGIPTSKKFVKPSANEKDFHELFRSFADAQEQEEINRQLLQDVISYVNNEIDGGIETNQSSDRDPSVKDMEMVVMT